MFGYLDDFKKILSGSSDKYENLGVESSGYADSNVSGTIQSSTNTIQNKFSFYKDVTNSVNEMINVITNTRSAPTFSVYIDSWAFKGNVNIIDLSWYAPYKEIGDNIICVFAYSMFLWSIFTRLPDIISGSGAFIDANNQLNDIHTYNKTGFGRGTSYHSRTY